MKIGTAILLGVLGLPLLAGASLGADSGNASPVDVAKQGDRSALQALLDRGTNVNMAQADGTTALFWAGSRNDAPMVDLLLKAGADANAANDYGATALYVAAANADEAVAVKLLDAKGD